VTALPRRLVAVEPKWVWTFFAPLNCLRLADESARRKSGDKSPHSKSLSPLHEL